MAFLAYFSAWDPSHWIRSVFLINFGTGNAVIHQTKKQLLIFKFADPGTLKIEPGSVGPDFKLTYPGYVNLKLIKIV